MLVSLGFLLVDAAENRHLGDPATSAGTAVFEADTVC